MRVSHLNCGSLLVPGGPLVCHVLLVETDAGLVLVDTGFGLADIAEPARRLGPVRYVIRPALRGGETAARQVEASGYRREDVRHIVLTHLDLDHIGGLADFPDAAVHLTRAEAAGGIHAPSRSERRRFRAVQWSHGPHLVEHDPDGERWNGFAAARELDDIAPGIVLVALPGHTRGHAAVAVDAGDHWVLHAGDAFYDRATLERRPAPPLLRTMERAVAFNAARVRDNHERLAELHARPDSDVRIVSAHDPVLFRQAAGSTGP